MKMEKEKERERERETKKETSMLNKIMAGRLMLASAKSNYGADLPRHPRANVNISTKYLLQDSSMAATMQLWC